MNKQMRRWMIGAVAVCSAVVAVIVLPSCGAPTAVRHMVADQNGLMEAGRALGLSELTVQMAGRHASMDPERWRGMITRASALSVSAGRLVLARATAVSGSHSQAERFYAYLDSDTAALRAKSESLKAELADALTTHRP